MRRQIGILFSFSLSLSGPALLPEDLKIRRLGKIHRFPSLVESPVFFSPFGELKKWDWIPPFFFSWPPHFFSSLKANLLPKRRNSFLFLLFPRF